ncbi:hypothetical protein AnigIFM63309_008561 [Aspergillus niger]|nr:hypothetical protein AnigIFM63309_008561 [Aspergillus niger]
MIRAYKLHFALVAILLAQYMADTTSDSSGTSSPTGSTIPPRRRLPRPPESPKGPSHGKHTEDTTTTYLIILRPRNTTPDDPLYNNLGASILDVNATTNQTTAIFNCQSSKLGNCRITVPVSATNGPSTAELTLTSVGSVTPLTDPTKSTTSLVIYAIHTYIVRSEITAPSDASCTTTDYAWESSDTFTFSYTSTSSSTFRALSYISIPVTAELEKLSRWVGVPSVVTNAASTATE